MLSEKPVLIDNVQVEVHYSLVAVSRIEVLREDTICIIQVVNVHENIYFYFLLLPQLTTSSHADHIIIELINLITHNLVVQLFLHYAHAFLELLI